MMLFTDWIAQAIAILPTNDLLYQERLSAFKKLDTPSFIAHQKEYYKCISPKDILSSVVEQSYAVSTSDNLSPSTLSYPNLVEKNILTFINGIWSDIDSSFLGLNTKIPRVSLRNFKALSVIEQQAVLSNHMADLRSHQDFFTTLHNILVQEVYFLEIPENSHFPDPIYIHHIVTEGASYLLPRIVIKIGKRSKVTIIEHWHTTTEQVSAFINPLNHISLDEEVSLTYYTLHRPNFPCNHVHNLYCNQQRHSHFLHYMFSFGLPASRINLTTHIQGSGAEAHLYGLYSLSNKEKIDHSIQVIHSAPYSSSKQHYKGILGGQSTGGFHGKIYLTPEAQQTNALQTNNIMMVSDKAYHNTKPQLEIYADDVKCSHGATVGQLDPEQLFYLATRGIEPSSAKRLLMNAFGQEIIETIPIYGIQEYVLQQFENQLMHHASEE